MDFEWYVDSFVLSSESDNSLESIVFPFSAILFLALKLLAMKEDSSSDESDSSLSLLSSSRWIALASRMDCSSSESLSLRDFSPDSLAEDGVTSSQSSESSL